MEKRLLMFLVGLFLSIGMAVAQTQVKGTVVSSEDGEPVVGASVMISGAEPVCNLPCSFNMVTRLWGRALCNNIG